MSSSGMRVEIILRRAADDPEVNSPEFQSELHTFSGALRSAGVSYSQRGMAFDSAAAMGYPLAEFAIKDLAPYAATVVTALTAWIGARYGRKVRFKVGDLELEARSPGEIERLVKLAHKHQAEQMHQEVLRLNVIRNQRLEEIAKLTSDMAIAGSAQEGNPRFDALMAEQKRLLESSEAANKEGLGRV